MINYGIEEISANIYFVTVVLIVKRSGFCFTCFLRGLL